MTILTTARLRFEPFDERHFDGLHAMNGDPEVMRFIGGKPFTREEAWTRFLRNVGHWEVHGFGDWVVRAFLFRRRLRDMAWTRHRLLS